MNRCVIEQYIGSFGKLFAALIYTGHHACRAHRAVDPIGHQEVITLEKPPDIEALLVGRRR